MAKYMTKSTVIERVDQETGEVIVTETRKDFRAKVEVQEFYMVFFEKMASFYGIKNISDMKVMICMCEIAEFNTGIVRMSKVIRQEIVEKTGVSYSNLSKNIKNLVKIGLLIDNGGDYLINPEVFWKGGLKERSEQLKINGITMNLTFYSPITEN